MWRRYRRRAEVLKTSDLIRFVRLIPQRFPRRFAVPNVFMVNNASYFLPVYSYVKRHPTSNEASEVLLVLAVHRSGYKESFPHQPLVLSREVNNAG